MKLNLGCGKDIRPGWVNVDFVMVDGVNVQWDLNTFPYPFEDNSVLEIKASHIIEHILDTISFMKELHRICVNGAIIRLKYPHPNSTGFFGNPTHYRYFNEESMQFFTKQKTDNFTSITGEFKIVDTTAKQNDLIAYLIRNKVQEIAVTMKVIK